MKNQRLQLGAALLAGVLLAAPARAQDENLIQDPTFETVGMVGTGAVWALNPADLDAKPLTGDHGPAVRLTSSAGTPTLMQHLRMPAEGNYEMRFEAKGTSDTRYRIYVEWIDGEGFHSAHSGWQPGNGGWDERVFDFQYPGAVSACYVVLQMTGEGAVEFAKPVLVQVAN